MQPMRLPPAVPQNGQAIARQKPGKLELLGQILKAVGEIGTGITMGAPAYAKFAQDRREATARQAMADASLQHNMQQDLEAQRRWDWANDPQRQAAERAIQRQENLSYAEAQARFKDQWEEMQRNKLADQMEADPSLRAYASSVRFGLPIRQDLNKSEIEIWQEAWLANPRNAGRPKTDMIEDYRKVYNANRSQTTGKKAEVIVNADGSRNLVFYDVNQPNQYSTTPIPGKAHVPGEGDTYQIIKDENTGQVWRVPVKAGAPQEVQKPEGGPLLSEKEKEFSSAQVGRIDSQAFMDAVREWNETPGNQAYDPKNQYAAQMDPAAFKWISTRAAENWDATAQRLFPTTSRSMNKNKPKSLMDIMADRFEAATQNFMKSQPEPRKKK